MTDINETLAERGSRYGPFVENAECIMDLQACVRHHHQLSFHIMCKYQQYALDMIMMKVGRIVTGDPDYIDNWHDIIGYATRALEELEGEK